MELNTSNFRAGRAGLAAWIIGMSVLGASAEAATTTILGTRVPANPSDPDSKAVEVGMKFRPSASARILGVRFYKGGTGNSGTHVGKLYSRSGSLLASATFANETSSGWQTVKFANPVSVSAGTTYVVSYFAPRGHYAADANGMSRAITDSTGLLTALANGTDGSNGVYTYGTSGGFPTQTYQATNYYVDVIAEPAATPAPSPSPTATATPTPAPTATATPAPTASPSATPSPSAQGLSFDASSGTITAPFTLSGGAVSQSSTTTAVDTTSGSAVYTFNVPTAGQYVLNVNVNAPSDSSNSLFLNVDSQPDATTMVWDIPVTQGFQTRAAAWRGSGTVDNNEFQPKVFTLSQGSHKLIIRGREGGTQFNHLEFVPASTQPAPSPTATATPAPTPAPTATATPAPTPSGTITGKSWYVTQSGAGSRNGTSLANAWSVADFNAATAPTGGDGVFFSGTITSTVNPPKSGTGNGTSRLTLDFSSATLNNASPRIQLSAKSYLNVIGGTFGNDTGGSLINFTGGQSRDITVKNWKFTGGSTGVTTFASVYYAYNLVLENNSADNISHFIMSDSILTHDVTLRNNLMRSSVNTTDQTDMVFMGDAYNVMIEGNKIVMRAPGAASVRHNDCIQTYMKGGSNAGNPHDWTVRYNWIEQNIAPGTSGDNSWMMMQAMTGEAMKIYGNVFFGNDSASRNGNNGINISRNVAGAKFYFYNNTVITKAMPTNVVRFLDTGTAYIRNNIGMADADETGTFLSWTMAEGGGTSGWDYNFWYQFDNATSNNAGPNGSTTTNPMFTNYGGNDFSLSASSPLRGAGDAAIGSEYDMGIVPGSSWPNPKLVQRKNWDPGAFESTQ